MIFTQIHLNRLAMPLLCSVGLGAAAWLLMDDWQDWSKHSAVAETTVTSGDTSPMRTQPMVSTQALLNAQLFGQVSASEQQVVTAQVTQETRLKLQLQGVFSNTVAEHSRALIAEQGKKASYYRVGDSLPGGATLNSVEHDRVILQRGGVLEALSFSNRRKDGRTVATVRRAPVFEQPQNNEEDVAQRTASIKDRLKRLREARDM